MGKTEAIHKLCDEFNRRTENGAEMVAYDNLLNSAIEHISRAHGKTQLAGLGQQGPGDFRLPKASEIPESADDFELVTWLAILSQKNG